MGFYVELTFIELHCQVKILVYVVCFPKTWSFVTMEDNQNIESDTQVRVFTDVEKAFIVTILESQNWKDLVQGYEYIGGALHYYQDKLNAAKLSAFKLKIVNDPYIRVLHKKNMEIISYLMSTLPKKGVTSLTKEEQDMKEKAAEGNKLPVADPVQRRELIGYIYEREGWWISARGQIFKDRSNKDTVGRRNLSVNQAEAFLLEHVETACKEKFKVPSSEVLKRSHTIFIELEADKEYRRIVDRLSTNSPLRVDNTLFSQMLRELILPDATDDFDLTVKVMHHLLWQIKCKANDKDLVHNSLMVILAGKQGTGKSTLIDMLGKPLGSTYTTQTFESLLDTKVLASLSRVLLVNVEELSKLKPTDVTEIKAFITGKDKTGRTMYTGSLDSHPLRTTIMGSTNTSIRENLVDDEMRRVYECLFRKDTSARGNMGKFHNIPVEDILQWYHAADMNTPEIFTEGTEAKTRLTKYQELELSTTHVVKDFWLEAMGAVKEFDLPDTVEASVFVSSTYLMFKEYCEACGQYACARKNFRVLSCRLLEFAYDAKTLKIKYRKKKDFKLVRKTGAKDLGLVITGEPEKENMEAGDLL